MNTPPRRPRTEPAAGDAFTASQSREELRAFLQRRVANFGLMFTFIFGMFFLHVMVNDHSASRAFLPWHAVAVLTFAGVWLLCRGRARSHRAIRWIEFAGVSTASGCATVMCWHISYAVRPDTILLLCLSYTMIARAIMVPSTGRRTLLYQAFFAPPFLASVYLIHRFKHDPSIYTAAADPQLRIDATTLATRYTIMTALWWIAASIITTATSKVIYGLQKEVRDARRLGQYTLTEKLGQGGMGVVYRARHAMLRRPSAIKLLPPDKFGIESVARFEREVQLTARLTHPNTIRVFDYGRTPDGIFYYVMELLEGATLDDVIAVGGPMPAGRVIHVLDQVAGALSEAHGIGLIHRDIKPANVFLTQQGGVPDVAKVLDFGLVKQVEHTPLQDSAARPLTHDNSITGTPQYMAPEALTSPESMDARSDLYTLGAVGYFLLTGEHVFSGRTLVEICSHHLHSLPTPASERLGRPVPPDLEALLLACLAKRPDERPESARAVQNALRACTDARTWSEDDARHWFEAHDTPLRSRQSHTTLSGPATVAIDLALRNP